MDVYSSTYSENIIQRVGIALKRAALSQLHPKMLAALLLPLLIALAGAFVLVWLFWTPLSNWLLVVLGDVGLIERADQWMIDVGLFSLKAYIVPIVVALIVFPSSGVLGLIIAAVFVMPIVLQHIQKRSYPQLRRAGENSTVLSATNACWVGLCFVIGWLVTLPFWLVPFLGVLLPVFWWAYAFTKILRIDSMVEHATKNERMVLRKRYRRDYWALGIVMALLSLLPPAWLIMPVFSALVFGHFSLRQLELIRSEIPAVVPHVELIEKD
ncbi:EI24 domain-containing protein [Paenalcaligenes niemegkensis]|uniref:EI24 domain-containing protein n=1 Tax=Paenalcaligenes niemegkensis TaxID=2895469 RepID=UPI001EE7BD71|nr:EI24 domain-containing protein [Paenalcaligenes niemegkensis]MCQ9617101.1 EI24 domain-containing protein [Paenalcaligenes niemegkensis]